MTATTEWLVNARYGMFVHYGLYSLLGRGEWVLNREQIPVPEYRQLAQRFTAEAFDADAICGLAKRAGMRYLIFTTMHHDGFCLYDTRLTDFSSARTAARRDLVAETVAAARRHGLRIALYHSLNNWAARPDAVEALESKQNYERFIDHTFERIRELVTLFNPIDVLWYDGWWPFDAKGWRGEEMNAMVRQIQPHILFNGRNGLPGDFGTPEQHISAPNPWRPWEACITLNGSWGYHAGDRDWKTPGQVVDMLAAVAQGRGNLALNIGPRGDGSVPEESVRILETVGAWLERCGTCVYDTDPFTFGLTEFRKESAHRGDWCSQGPMTAKGHDLYLLLRRWPGAAFALGGLEAHVKHARLLGAVGRDVAFHQDHHRVTFSGLPDEPTDPVCPVLQLECDRPPSVYLCGGMRTPTVRHPHYDPCPSDMLG